MDQLEKEIVEDLAYVGNDVASVATHGNLLRAVVPLIKTCTLTNSEVAEFLDLCGKIVNRMEKEVQGCQE